MPRIRLRRPSAGVTLAFTALVVALSGTAVALPGKNTVKSDDIKSGAVTSSDIRNNSVRSTDVRDGALLSKDFKSGQLPAGRTGPAGPTGPAGSARAYAHVNADGTVDEAHSKGVADSNVALMGDSGYCFHGLAFTPAAATATIDYSDENVAMGDIWQAQYALGDPYDDCSGVGGTQAEVATMSAEAAGGFAPASFWIVFQ